MPSLRRWRRNRAADQQDEEPTEPAPPQLVQSSNNNNASIPISELAQESLRVPADSVRNFQDGLQSRTTPSTTAQPTEQKWGLFLLNPKAHPNDSHQIENTYPIDIVAVHGITGSAFSSWTSKNETFWLRDFLPNEFPGARIFSYGYPADVFFSKERGDIGTFARTLLQKLCRERDGIEMRRRPIIFVCHSMGGIVVKQALITAKIESDSYDPILKSVTDILFFATPHRGVDNVNLLKNLLSIINVPTKGIGLSSSVRSDLLKALRKESKELRDISTNFAKVIPDLKVVSFVEKKTMSIMDRLVVDEDTAVMNDPRETIKHMDGCDHQSICRFENQDDEGYKDVLYQLRTAASRATNKILDEMEPKDIVCLNSLAYSEMWYRSDEVDRAAPNTCCWILRHPSHIAWIRQSRGLLWVKGKPGSGKSTLMAFLHREFHTLPAPRTQVNLSFFFHGRGTLLQRSAEGMFRSLLHQLYRRFASARRLILSAFNEKHIFGEAGKAWEWRVKELQDLFSMALKEVAQWSEVTIFVDALDETGSESAAKLVNYFHQLNDTVAADRHSSVKICISCRHYPVVARSPGLEILVEKENYRDIWTFVHGELEKSQSRPEDPLFIEKRKELGYEIVKKAENSFQWTGMILPKVLAFLNDGESFEDISNMIAGESSDLSRRNRTRTLFLMQWVCLAERPLSLTELRYALACDDEVVQPHQVRCDDSKMFVESDGRMKTLVNSLSGGLVETRHHESECIVQVCHQTVNDFLKSSGLRFLLSRTGNENLTVDEVIGRSQDRLSRCCINYLKLGEVLNENRIWNEEPVNDLFFIEYATKYWAVHAEKAENHGISHEGLVEEISALFGTWANIYRAIDKRASRCPEPGSTLIHIAAESNLRSTVEALLQNGTSVEEETDLNNRPLHYAARWGHESLAALLLDANADREAKNLYGGTPLERAAANNHERVVKMLLDRGVNVNEKTGWYGTALESASRKGSGRLVRMLIDNGADINARGEDGSNPLQAAALNGDKAILQLLLDEGAHVNAVGGFWGTALQAAALGIGESSEACVRILLESGAQVNLRGGHNDNALQAAAACSKDNAENLVRILLDNGADVNFYGGEYGSALQAGASCGSEQVVHMLLNAGADVHLKGGRCGNALQAAASRGHERLVQLLLDKGSDIHAEGGLYGSALNGAASGAHRAVMNLLLDQGADINAECGDCGSVLQAATYRCNESVIQWLIKRGAKVNAQCGEFGTALQAAAHWNRNEKILQLLLDNGADVNAKSSGMCATPLQSASYVGNVAAVKFLLDNGADINTQGGWYGSALQAAVAFHEQEVVKLLLERGADITAKEGFYGNVFEAARDDKSMIQILLEYSAET